jgi:hypothetical protein
LIPINSLCVEGTQGTRIADVEIAGVKGLAGLATNLPYLAAIDQEGQPRGVPDGLTTFVDRLDEMRAVSKGGFRYAMQLESERRRFFRRTPRDSNRIVEYFEIHLTGEDPIS